MVATIDDDQYTLMPLFVLALVSKGGVNTLYALQHQAGLQPGGVQPVLRLLEQQGLLHRSGEGKRRRRVMLVTDKGNEVLASNWQSCLSLYWDAESVLRAATTSLLMGDQRSAHDYLLNIAGDYDRKSSGTHRDNAVYQGSPMERYGQMRTQWEAARFQSAAQTLHVMANRIAGSAEFCSTTGLVMREALGETDERQVRIGSERAR